MSNYSNCCNSELTTDNCCCECGNPHQGNTFKIIRFRRNPETGEVTKRVTERGLSLHDAEKHCGKEGTHGDDWFDGFTAE